MDLAEETAGDFAVPFAAGMALLRSFPEMHSELLASKERKRGSTSSGRSKAANHLTA
jgi:hypothetical protein